jgi:ABC-type enterochelin transport system substrate-binding protein
MNAICKLGVLAALGAVGSFLSQESRAADAVDAANSDALTTIVVTAEKKEEKLKDVPMSITALGGNSLDTCSTAVSATMRPWCRVCRW